MPIMSGNFRLGRDGETRYLPSGEPVMNLSVAYDYGTKDQGTGHRPSQWIDAALWGKRAASLESYLRKGMTVFLVLEDVHMQSFKKADGTPKDKMVGRVAMLEFVSGTDRDGERQEAPAPRPAAPASRTPPAPRQAAVGGSGFDDMDDDIPF